MVWANWDVEELRARQSEIVNDHLLQMQLAGWEQNY